MDYDIRIVGGEIVDGTGSAARRGDVGIRDGRIVALGDAPGTAAETIEAHDRVVTPGFVDVHTHYDAQVLWDRGLSISPWHGVTTAVMGNCGFGVAPTRPRDRTRILQTLEKVEGMSLESLQAGLGTAWPFETFPQYLDAIERRGAAINLGVLVGHTPVRLWTMGEAATEREASEAEVATMRALVREAAEAGALGFATSKAITHNGYGGRPVPSRVSSHDEIATLAAASRDGGAPLMQVTIGKELFIEEMSQLSRELAIRVTWTALLAGMGGAGAYRRYLEQTAAHKARGADVVPQVSCRPLNFDFDFADPFPFEAMKLFNLVSADDVASPGARRRAYADPAWRQRFRDETMPFLQGWPERTVIGLAPGQADLEEQTVAGAARAAGKDPVDFTLDLALATDLKARFRMAMLNFNDSEVAELLRDPNTVVALSDAGAHASQLCDACYATHLLGHWVRDKSTLGLEQAVHMLTQRPASLFGIHDRGVLAVGRPADVVVLDPATVGPSPLRRVHDLPAGADRLVSDARGIDAVIVNGRLLRRHGRDTLPADGPLPGRLLRHGRAA